MATRKGIGAGTDNNTLLERRFMFATSRQVPQTPHFMSAPVVPSAPQNSQNSQNSQTPQNHQAERSSDYLLFLRSFDSNQRLSEQGSHQIQMQVEQYKHLHDSTLQHRFHPVLVQPGVNSSYDRLEGLSFMRQGEQTRYNTKKNEHNLSLTAMKQYDSSYTPQNMQMAMSQIYQYSPQVMPILYKKKKHQKHQKHQK